MAPMEPPGVSGSTLERRAKHMTPLLKPIVRKTGHSCITARRWSSHCCLATLSAFGSYAISGRSFSTCTRSTTKGFEHRSRLRKAGAMRFEYRGRSVDIRDGSTKRQRCYDILVDGKGVRNFLRLPSWKGHRPCQATYRCGARQKLRTKTVGLKGSEMDIRRCTKKDVDAINERPRAWKAQEAKQTGHQASFS